MVFIFRLSKKLSIGQVEVESESNSQDGVLTDVDSSSVQALDGIMFNVMTSRHVTGNRMNRSIFSQSKSLGLLVLQLPSWVQCPRKYYIKILL